MKPFESHFNLMGKRFTYHSHPYNTTRINERSVEVAVGLYLLNQSTRCLEVGAVLPHYKQPLTHTCIDRSEVFPGVINADVLKYKPKGKFDFIISISTLDHLNSADEVMSAVKRMRSWLTDTGLMLVTLPYGQPPEIGGGAWLDDLVLDNRLDPSLLVRLDKTKPTLNGWEEIAQDQELLAYNGRTRFANSLFLLFWGDLDGWW